MKNNPCIQQKIIDGLTYCGLSGGLACNDCICSNCGRKMPNPNFKRGIKCQWCQSPK
jgi:primosomal protein N'